MRTTVAIDDKLLAKAQEFTGLHEKSEAQHGRLRKPEMLPS